MRGQESYTRGQERQRRSQQLLDSDEYIYDLHEESAERRRPPNATLPEDFRRTEPRRSAMEDNILSLGTKSHCHPAESSVPEKGSVIRSLKRKEAEHLLSVTQNLISEALVGASLGINQTLPTTPGSLEVLNCQ